MYETFFLSLLHYLTTVLKKMMKWSRAGQTNRFCSDGQGVIQVGLLLDRIREIGWGSLAMGGSGMDHENHNGLRIRTALQSTDAYTNWDVNEPSNASVSKCAYVDSTTSDLKWWAKEGLGQITVVEKDSRNSRHTDIMYILGAQVTASSVSPTCASTCRALWGTTRVECSFFLSIKCSWYSLVNL